MGCRLIICCWGMNSTSICILYYYDTYVQKDDDVSLLIYYYTKPFYFFITIRPFSLVLYIKPNEGRSILWFGAIDTAWAI